ncbi:lipase family protein [Sorangium sp. So ce363]|uniref:lipase family protein n=1 Tax=Sorangium sp. So ce363 TaxID=3133304 RepID=UPI003F610BDA
MFVTNVERQEERKGTPANGSALDLLGKMERNQREYDETIAYALSLASAWSYADPQTLHDVMNSLGFENRCYAVTLSNDSVSVRTSASLLQHVDGSAAILCFRGTERATPINRLTDASVEPDRFHAWEAVQGGLYRSRMPMTRYIACRLKRAMKGQSVVDQKSELVSVDAPACSDATGEPLKHRLKALYITGHGLGGALAALAAAMIFQDKEHEGIRDVVRGVYTYGQPRIGNEIFARRCQDAYGRLLFRHIHANDVVPMFPPPSIGRFEQFGHELRSSAAGWVFSEQPARRADAAPFGSTVDVLAWIKQRLPLVRRLHLPFSSDDHAPHWYVSVSQRSLRLRRSELVLERG